ncbi:3-keto-5-aminohexanoate cleavage protein [Hwanghaeella grinnelliae]|uniref:3-keto-5-aminohexanoate cleavage protein n=1 Tax=Hwanghaeella grinnelliae TaxID=2500179 RepID=A0A3S2Y2S7_9PROT|nr:3-keto-5-aminohexanoate cleavage protein [Hwanghaeella grinnelliae]RVU36381.1 3-keto-5-aminohexanoate cleavage protein [Hwanghaeella grinnelliae]
MTDTGKPVWLEVAINGPWSRDLQPLAPRGDDAIIAEGIACARAGASIIHLHIFDETGDRQVDDAAQYEKIIRAIHGETGAIVYGTLPFHASSADRPLTAVERYAAVEELAKHGAIEWSIVDPGSVNVSSFQAMQEGREGFVYLNPEDHIRRGLTLARDHGFTPSYAIYEPGFLRQGAALHAAMPGTPQPVYRFMFSEAYSFGFPPKQFALDAYLNLMAEAAPSAPWMVAGLGVDITPMIAPAVQAGGHVRVGLEDAPVRDARSNLDWIAIAVDEIEKAGGRVATPDEVRDALKS